MKHIVKILSLVIAITALWVGLLQTSIIPQSHTWLVGLFPSHVLLLNFFFFFVVYGTMMFWGEKAYLVPKL
jgi:uncharacterized membrane protein